MRRLPLWARWALTLLAFGTLSIAAVIAVKGSNESSQEQQAAALIEASRAARKVVIRDQAPRSSALPGGVSPGTGLERAIGADVRSRVRRDELEGPAQGVRCAQAKPERASRRPFRCTARAGGFGYPFRGVADLRARRLTWCKFDPVPPGQAPVPLSAKCEG